jgi:outer membrane translocation and assembly module TamA
MSPFFCSASFSFRSGFPRESSFLELPGANFFVERCLPYPSFAQEISAMDERTDLSQEPSPKTKRDYRFRQMRSRNPTSPISAYPNCQVDETRTVYYDSESDWLEELQDGIKGLLQDSGYFRLKVNAHAIDGNHRNKRCALTLHIEEGRQHRLGAISFVRVNDDAALAFPASELREHIRLTRGELFSASKIRNGVEELTRLYGTNGYIDMVPIPEIQTEGDDGPINLVMRLDQGKPYRVGKVEFLGLNEKMQNELTSKLKPGDSRAAKTNAACGHSHDSQGLCGRHPSESA